MLAACGPFPRDIDGTLDRIEQTHTIRIGLAELSPTQMARAHGLIDRLAQATGAKVELDNATAEAQLARLENHDLDLVVAELAEDTPWIGSVAVLEPLQRRVIGGRVMGLAAVTANGENRWVALVERQVRNSASDGA